MGVVIDFVAFVLGRSRRLAPVAGPRDAPRAVIFDEDALRDALARPAPVAGPRDAPRAVIFDEDALRDALARLDGAQARDVLGLGGRFATNHLGYGPGRRQAAGIAMQACPEAAWIFCFDPDGHIREAAVRRLNVGAATTGRLVALALRLNDWVPEVRREAALAFRQVWPLTPPNLVAAAAPYLLRQRFAWRRWTDEGACVDEAFADPAVAAAVAALLLRGRSGALGRTLAQGLRFAAYDGALAELAAHAALPEVRAVAARTLLRGVAVWSVGLGWAWVDRSLGVRRRVTLTETRPVSAPEPATLLRAALADRSALVRKVAADAVVERMSDLPDIAEIAARLAADASAAVRDRADYLTRHLAPPAAGADTGGPS